MADDVRRWRRTADEAEVSGITNALVAARGRPRRRREPGQPERLRPVEPAGRSRLQGRRRQDGHKLLIGEKSPTGGDLFAKRDDDKKVFLIPAAQETTFNRTTFDLRDKTLLKFDRDKVDGIDVTAGGKTLALAKDGGELED